MTTSTDATMNSMPADRESLYLMTKLKLDRKYVEIVKRVNADNISLIDQVTILYKGVQELFPYKEHERYLMNFNKLTTIAKANTSSSNGLLKNERSLKVVNDVQNIIIYLVQLCPNGFYHKKMSINRLKINQHGRRQLIIYSQTNDWKQLFSNNHN